MTDAIVEQAAAAAATPANGAPAPVAPAPAPKPTPPPAPTTTPANPEARRQEIMKEADYWKDGPKTAALRAEMRAIVDSNPDVPAPARPKPAEPPVGPTTLELRQREIIVKLSDRNTPEEEKQKLRIEQRALIASQDTPEEKAARARMTLGERREEYGVADPTALVLRGHVEEYTENFSSWETDLFDIARTTGMDGNMVGALRDEAITLGELVAERGVPATKEELDLVFKRANVPPASRKALTDLWLRVQGKAE